MSRYWKAILAALGSAATWGITASADGVYEQVELWGLLAGVVATLAVYQKGNTPPEGEAPDPMMSEQHAPDA